MRIVTSIEMSDRKPFTTDGCSGGMSIFWRVVFRAPPPWEGACVEHDRAYWKGGTRKQRKEADDMLRFRVTMQGYPVIAALMYWAVRIGGMPYWPLSHRWGYGYRWPKHCFYRKGNGQ